MLHNFSSGFSKSCERELVDELNQVVVLAEQVMRNLVKKREVYSIWVSIVSIKDYCRWIGIRVKTIIRIKMTFNDSDIQHLATGSLMPW